MNHVSHIATTHDDIISSLDQIDSLISIAMNGNLGEIGPKTTFNYFLVISNLIASVRMKCVGL